MSERTNKQMSEAERTSESRITMHSGPKVHKIDTFISQTNERALRSARAKRAVRSKRMSEQCERMSERTNEWSSTHVPITGSTKPPCDGSALA